jgi:hypothetical protein
MPLEGSILAVLSSDARTKLRGHLSALEKKYTYSAGKTYTKAANRTSTVDKEKKRLNATRPSENLMDSSIRKTQR